MTFTVEDGTGKADANSYITIEYADNRLEELGLNANWDTYSTLLQQQACVKATNYIDMSFDFDGMKNSREQSLEWPRTRSYDKNNYAIPDDEVPVEVKKACAELALILISNPGYFSETQEQSQKKVKVGSLEVEYADGSTASRIFTNVKNYLEGIGRYNRYGNACRYTIT